MKVPARKSWLNWTGRGAPLVILAALLVTVSLPSCSRQRTTSRPARISEYEKNERTFETNEQAVAAGIYEEFVDSLALKTDKLSPAQATGNPPPVSFPPNEMAPGVTIGWRVQLGAFADQEGAEDLAARARKQLGLTCQVYVRFYEPLWKVQAGDCTTRDEARALQSFLQRSGFPDAWIVSSGINR